MSVLQHEANPVAFVRTRVPEVVIVAPSCDRFAGFVRAAQAGEMGLQFCVNGHSAMRLARRFAADAWIVAADLPDVSGFDLIDMLPAGLLQGAVDPPRAASRTVLDRVDESPHGAIFLVADDYRLEDEQRALAAGVAGFFVHPVTPDVIRDSLQHGSAAVAAGATLGCG